MRAILMIAATMTVTACADQSEGPTQRETIGQVWKYEGGESGTGGKVAKVAYIGSVNSVPTMTAPDTFSVLLVQPLKQGGADVTVKLVGAPFTCDLSDCRVTATTDDGRRHAWQGRMATNDDGIAIAPSQGAYDVIRDAKRVKIDLVVDGKAGTAPFVFNVAGLDLKG
ncbi:hypothetical protein Q4610_03930 [Sphingobium sp. HBC34]|uniref:Uncharacterized protein n=1 Tax=Sphingobium cyanobacteriorum TaxID=3063954 RepID=A0ABT8ZJ11_9SPHN|nr:hypothetical protein [Sphingobium sp. HBC34]MDO7834187.1 hypothetical protein [Sphingobium sp. HBC34]